MKYAPYSFSKISIFFDCPKKFEFAYINKIEKDDTYIDPIYFRRGRFLHAYIADRLNGGDGTKLKNYNVSVDEKMKLTDMADDTLNHEYIMLTYDFDINSIETYISLDKNLEPTRSKIENAIGGYVDYFAIKDTFGTVIDWKSGKARKCPDFSQLELYAIWLFQKYPDLDELDLVFFYVEHNTLEFKTITPNDVFSLKNDLIYKIDTIEKTHTFSKKESDKCVECPFFNSCLKS